MESNRPKEARRLSEKKIDKTILSDREIEKQEKERPTSVTNIRDESVHRKIMAGREGRPGSPVFYTEDYINEELNVPKTFVSPRLFVISNNNTGYELLTDKQVTPWKKWKEKVLFYI